MISSSQLIRNLLKLISFLFLKSAFIFGNSTPTNLDSLLPLSVNENEPAHTYIGEFNATDQDINSSLVFSLVDGLFDLNSDLLAYYPLDKDALDHGQHRNHGQIIGNPSWGNGIVGNALSGSSSNYVRIAHSNTITLGRNAGRNWSISLWFFLRSRTGNWENIFSKRGSNSGATDYALALESGKIY